jgi:hypothetical protein
MKTLTNTLRRRWRTGLLAAAVTAVVGGATLAPAFADADDWHRGDRDRHEQAWRGWRDRDWDADRPTVYVAPGYGYYGYGGYAYAPAPGYGYSYAPAPVYTAPSLSLGFVFR